MNIKATSLIYFQNVVVKNYGLQVQTPFWISTKLNLADIQNYCHSVLMLDKLLINGNSIIWTGALAFEGRGGGGGATNERHNAGFCQTQSLSFQAKNMVLNSSFTDAKGKRWSSLSYVGNSYNKQYSLDLQTRGRRHAHFTPSLPLSISALFYGQQACEVTTGNRRN